MTDHPTKDAPIHLNMVMLSAEAFRRCEDPCYWDCPKCGRLYWSVAWRQINDCLMIETPKLFADLFQCGADPVMSYQVMAGYNFIVTLLKDIFIDVKDPLPRFLVQKDDSEDAVNQVRMRGHELWVKREAAFNNAWEIAANNEDGGFACIQVLERHVGFGLALFQIANDFKSLGDLEKATEKLYRDKFSTSESLYLAEYTKARCLKHNLDHYKAAVKSANECHEAKLAGYE
jgi:hypothetical protein